MDGDRLKKQLDFLVEIDKMKMIFRRNVITDGSRAENDAEHSWHMAMCALVLHEYAPAPKPDLSRVLSMILVHDLVEIYAGDTFCYDAAANKDKQQREEKAADKLFALLPPDQADEYRALWEEFDKMESPDALFAAAVDRLQPFLLNYNTDGHTWRQSGADSAMVYARLEKLKEGLPILWDTIDDMVKTCIEKGLIRP